MPAAHGFLQEAGQGQVYKKAPGGESAGEAGKKNSMDKSNSGLSKSQGALPPGMVRLSDILDNLMCDFIQRAGGAK